MTHISKSQYLADLTNTKVSILQDLTAKNEQKRFIVTFNRLIADFENEKIGYFECLGKILNRYAQIKGIQPNY
jgi:hypothetical protein